MKIKVNSATLASEASAISDLVKDAEKKLQTMYTLVRELDSKWEGPANEGFVNSFGADYEEFKAICKTGASLASNMKKAAREYERCENEITDGIKRLNI